MALILSGDTGVPASGMPTGSVIQVVSVNNPSNPTPTTSSAVTLLTTTFTPKFATSKVLAMMTTTVERGGGGSGNYIFISLQRNGSTVSSNWSNALGYQLSNGARSVGAQNYLDSPATTSAITYSYVADFSVSGNVAWYVYNLNLTLMEIAA